MGPFARALELLFMPFANLVRATLCYPPHSDPVWHAQRLDRHQACERNPNCLTLSWNLAALWISDLSSLHKHDYA
jgi:hypothetical protein